MKLDVTFRFDHGDMSEMLSLLKSIGSQVVKELNAIHRQGALMSQEMDDLQAKVSALRTTVDSIKTFIQGLAAQILANAEDPAKLRAMAAELQTDSDDLVAAMTTTPPAPTP